MGMRGGSPISSQASAGFSRARSSLPATSLHMSCSRAAEQRVPANTREHTHHRASGGLPAGLPARAAARGFRRKKVWALDAHGRRSRTRSQQLLPRPGPTPTRKMGNVTSCRFHFVGPAAAAAACPRPRGPGTGRSSSAAPGGGTGVLRGAGISPARILKGSLAQLPPGLSCPPDRPGHGPASPNRYATTPGTHRRINPAPHAPP